MLNLWGSAFGGLDVSNLIQLADQKNLAESNYWHILLHYKKKSTGGYQSLVDGPSFFLAPKGKTDPHAELHATIRAIFSPKSKSVACRFILRYTWLKEQLSIEHDRTFECEEFLKMVSDVDPQSTSVIFPTYHMNNPASMFGHTLIRVERDAQSKLIAHAINYAASTQETNGFLFAFKGLLGFYKGFYSIMPYYQKIQEYSDINQRDIWEYQLYFNQAETRMLLMHLWELKHVYSDYYFFDENCSYNLLFLLEAARPSLHLSDQFSLWVLPIETINAMKIKGLIKNVQYRPSRATKIKNKIAGLTRPHQDIVFNIIHGNLWPHELLNMKLATDDKIRIIDLTIEYNQYLYARKKRNKSSYRKLLLKTLQTRSKLGQGDKNMYQIPPPSRPDQMHDFNRLSIGAGLKNSRFFQEIRYRPVFCDLTDTNFGYHEGIQIEFGNINFRYYSIDNQFEVEHLSIIDIISISPRDKFFKPYSWKVNTGWFRKQVQDDHSLVYHLNTGSGVAYYLPSMGLNYVMAEVALNLGGGLDKNFALGIGASAGIIKNITKSLRSHLKCRWINFALGARHKIGSISLIQTLGLTRNTSINLDISRHKEYNDYNSSILLRFNLFF